jgi:hypothetical protein
MKQILLALMLLLTLQVKSQVSMTVQLPPTGVLQKSQLWNLLLVSATAGVRVQVALRILDAQTNQPVLTGVSRTLILNKGAKQLQAGDVMPVTYEYLAPAADRTPNGMLTAGSYMACYTVLQLAGDVSNVLAEQCLPFSVDPVSPPLLNTPADQSVVESNLPQFTWLPPAPLNIYSDLNYDMVMVELRPGQSPAEAIQQNIPVFRAPHNRSLFVNYPVGGVQLDTAKKYAWTVTANNGNQFSAQTEIWTFKIKGVQAVNVPVIAPAYVQLKRELDGSEISCGGILQVGYVNDAGDGNARYEIVSMDAQAAIVKTGTVPLRPGNNLVALPIDGACSKAQHYLFRIYSSRNETWQIKFIYSPAH